MKNYSNIFETTQCLSDEMMQAYIGGKLTSEQNHSVEKHTAQCPLCNDATEGLKAMKNPDKLVSFINKIDKKIDNRIRPKNRIKPLYRIKPILTVAAALLLIVAIGYIIRTSVLNISSDHTMADQVEMIPDDTSAEKLNTLTNDSESYPEEIKSKSPIDTSIGTVTTSRRETEMKTDDTPIKYALLGAESPIEDESVEDELAEIVAEASKELPPDDAKTLSEDSDAEASDEALNESDIFFGTARTALNREKLSEQELNETTIEKKYEQALNQYNAQNLMQAAALFDEIINSDSTRKFDAMWYRALLLEIEGDSLNAAQMFKKVANSKSKFKPQAKEKLEH